MSAEQALMDPSTQRPLPSDAIQRILYIAPAVHVYNIPPLTSTKGYVAASWTENNNARQIFTARLRVIETAIPTTTATSSAAAGEKITVAVVLEDAKTADLFAAAPYNAASAVEQVLDSSRFFALRVQDPSGRKAVLGIGFEERSDAFDFSVSLQEVRKTLGLEKAKPEKEKNAKQEKQRDFSLKEGETIVVNIGGNTGTPKQTLKERTDMSTEGFSLPPPPNGVSGFLPPPPNTQELKAQNRSSHKSVSPANDIADLGFDDGEFGEFQ